MEEYGDLGFEENRRATYKEDTLKLIPIIAIEIEFCTILATLEMRTPHQPSN
jgi:hypothetical protein